MRKSAICLAAFSAAIAVGVASAAQAADGLFFNQDLQAPGVYYGSGNPNGDFVVDTEDGVEVALRAHVYQQVPIASVGDVYSFATAATNAPTNSLSFDWSVNPDVGLDGPVSLAGATAILTIQDVANHNTESFPANFILLGNATTPNGGYQNSERLVFSFVDSDYNATQNDTFLVNLTLTGVPVAGTISVNEVIQQGSGAAVPEPASWALMILGFGGVGATLRRSRKTAAAATA